MALARHVLTLRCSGLLLLLPVAHLHFFAYTGEPALLHGPGVLYVIQGASRAMLASTC